MAELYLCKVHGAIDGDWITECLVGGVVIARLCSRCYIDFVIKNVGEVEQVIREIPIQP